jgi:U3 small nucleolar ribonucleoprotein protein LCP5
MEAGSASEDEEDGDEEDAEGNKATDGIYRPPKLAPVPYTETTRGKDKKERRRPVPTALSNLQYLNGSQPHAESTSGLGAATLAQSEAASARARELARMTEFEEENFTRLLMKKKDAKRRARDEADVALGGVPSVERGGRRRGGGFEDEFGDVLRSVGRSRNSAVGDGYEELRQRGRKDGLLARSRKRDVSEAVDAADEGPKLRKRSRFDKEAKAAKKRMRR